MVDCSGGDPGVGDINRLAVAFGGFASVCRDLAQVFVAEGDAVVLQMSRQNERMRCLPVIIAIYAWADECRLRRMETTLVSTTRKLTACRSGGGGPSASV